MSYKEWIIVSEKVRSSVTCSFYSDSNTLFAESPAELLSTLIDTSKDQFAVIAFIAPDEFFAMDVILHSAPHKVEPAIHIIAKNADQPIEYDNSRIYSVRYSPYNADEYKAVIKTSHTACGKRLSDNRQLRESIARLEDMRQDQDALIKIGRSLQTEKDSDTLLRTILMMSKKITGADAGSIYIIEEPKGLEKRIRFKYSHTFSKELPLEEFVMPYNTKSITGYVAITGKVLNIPDVYKLSAEDPISFNASFDHSTGYRSKSMLVVPMRNHIDQIIGVIQLINSKEDSECLGNEAFTVQLTTPEDFDKFVVTFDARYEHLMEAVAGQAAIAIENNRMINTIQSQFEEFVKASVSAIESRDPATSGHSFRVADICVTVARAINEKNDGPYANVNFTDNQLKELEYAALLHDFGKVYIDLAIFMKSKKLFPRDLDNLLLKMDYLYRFVELRSLEKRLKLFMTNHHNEKAFEELDNERDATLARITKIKETIRCLNEPTVTDLDPVKTLKEIYSEIEQIQCSDPDGNPLIVFGPVEMTNLSIPRGSLNDDERKEIESHVVHTYSFVNNIPWPPEYENIPEIALRHHEKMDGTGYPNRDKGEQIPIQSRIMALADIYDALTSTDRPYKKAIPYDTAISILKKEAESNKLDRDVLEVFLSIPKERYTKK
jgi:HD-GYP domain-containing protein (c-di-GMP phosphodiesterase class II)